MQTQLGTHGPTAACAHRHTPTRQLAAAPQRRHVAARVANVDTSAPSGSDAAEARAGGDVSKCPVLAARQQLRTPRLLPWNWFKRVDMEIFSVTKFQQQIVHEADGEAMVRLPKQPGFAGSYWPITPELTKAVFTQEAAGTITQGLAEDDYKAFPLLLGADNLLVIKDPVRHAKLRALLAPAFAGDAVAGYLPAVQALASRHLAGWAGAGGAGVQGYPRLKTLTFDFILQVVMGYELPRDELQRLSDLFSVLGVGLLAWPYLDLPFTPFRRSMNAKRELVAFFQEGVNNARQQLAAGQQVPGVLGRLVAAQDEEGNRLTDAEVTSNLLLVLFAGHDTSSTTLTRCLANLQHAPACMHKLRAEQQAVLAKHGEAVTAAALKQMSYADAVIRESLRRHPTVDALMRVTNQDMALGGYAVPAGSVAMLPLKHLAMADPRWVNETGELAPAVFNPERLLTPEGARPGQQMPFGAGSRYCLGAGLAMAEMKVFLALLARGYSFTADTDTEWRPAIGLYPVNGLPLTLKPL